MNNKRILITGSGGFVGKRLYKDLKQEFDILGIGKTKNEFVDEVVDLSNEELTFKILNSFNPDVIVHLAALSNVEKCESDNHLADKNNIYPVKKIVQWTEANDKRLLYVSSDYVFEGTKGGYSEKDLENPVQYYGKTKLAGEKIVSSLKNYVILRPTVIYGWDPDGMNFFMQLYRNQKDGKTMNVPVDQISNPVSVYDFCALIKKILNDDVIGKFVATGNEAFSRYEFALNICDCMGWDSTLINPVKTEFLNQVAKRPLNNSTVNNLVVKKFKFSFNDLKENIKIIKDQINSYQKFV